MEQATQIRIADYTYELPNEKIALYPLEQRDTSKLLVYKQGQLQQTEYRHIANHLPDGSVLVFNDTRVINARILFQKATGGMVEIFCLEPYGAITAYDAVMTTTQRSVWKCMIGGASKWKSGPLVKEIMVQGQPVELYVSLIEKLPDAYVAEFWWQPAHIGFAEILLAAGDVPLPPYIKRDTNTADTERYQTIYARQEGSVAAPTAGLHFTDGIFEALAQKNITRQFVTLHVGAGTFKPVKADTMQEHIMHSEWIDVSAATINALQTALPKGITAVGTTSLRTLESLYWLGVKASLEPYADSLQLNQWDVYETPLCDTTLSPVAALAALQTWLLAKGKDRLFTTTQLLIAPGYTFKMVQAIVTNFHQPQSTLLLLVAAAVGPQWRNIYQYALENDFRFLSYGDGGLLYIG